MANGHGLAGSKWVVQSTDPDQRQTTRSAMTSATRARSEGTGTGGVGQRRGNPAHIADPLHPTHKMPAKEFVGARGFAGRSAEVVG